MPSPMNSDVILFGLGSFLNHETVKKYPASLAARLIKVDPCVLPSCSKTHQLMHLLTPRGRDSTGLPPPMQITPRSAAGLFPLLLGNAPGQTLYKMPSRALCSFPHCGSFERRCGPSPFAAGDLCHTKLLGLLDLHRGSDPGPEPPVLACLVFLQYRGTS
ncbi:hypothetical protein HispidOSU_023831 [Sigmodon hispidus]